MAAGGPHAARSATVDSPRGLKLSTPHARASTTGWGENAGAEGDSVAVATHLAFEIDLLSDETVAKKADGLFYLHRITSKKSLIDDLWKRKAPPLQPHWRPTDGQEAQPGPIWHAPVRMPFDES